MSGDKDPPDRGEDKKKSLRLVKPGEPSPSAKPSSEQIKQLYMASNHIEWTPFAKSMGWKSLSSRTGLPTEEWVSQKKEIFAREQAETIAEAVFEHRARWHTDVLKTLREYPEANDAMMGILKKRLNDIIATINDDENSRVLAAQTGQVPINQFKQIKTSELSSLAVAIKVCTEAKHKALMIDNWSFTVAEQYADPNQFRKDDDKVKNAEWTVKIIGGEKINGREMGKFIGDWYDKPRVPHTREEAEESANGDEDA